MFLEMSGGHVLNLSRRELGEYVIDATRLDIFAEKFSDKGDSKAKRLRSLWEKESDHLVGSLLLNLCEHASSLESKQDPASRNLNETCRKIVKRLTERKLLNTSLKEHSRTLDAKYLEQDVIRLEKAAESDPSQAIGSAKELIETTCKTILSDRGIQVPRSPTFGWLTKETLRVLKLVPEGISDSKVGANAIKVTLSNLASISLKLEELRNLYGTGHGKHGRTKILEVRHAKLAAHCSAVFCEFILDTHKARTS